MTPLRLEDKKDYLELFEKINQPLRRHYQKNHTRIYFGQNGVGYGKDIAGMEGFSRMLWGAGPAVGQLDDTWFDEITSGILEGTDPRSEHYWGDIHARDQRMVEMPAIALALLYDDNKLWKAFEKDQQHQIMGWLSQIFRHESPDGNWQFFKVIVAIVSRKLDYAIHTRFEQEAKEKIDHCYLEDGWYQDSSRGRQDYYTPFAFHYYGLIYSVLAPEDPISAVFRERAKEFVGQFIHFFDEDGANIPFGRSMIYRHAASAFWSAVVYADLCPDKIGEIKGIIQRNLAWWIQKPIFDAEGLLTMGYAYPQLTLTEPYNSSVSPYWSNKVFLLLSLPEGHPFWSAEAMAYPEVPAATLLKSPNLLAVHDNGHSFLLNAGQPGPNYHAATTEKYLKFAYSSRFGFSIPRGTQLKEEAVMDSMLGIQNCDTKITISRNGQSVEETGPFFVRNQVADIEMADEFVASTWKVNADMSIRTWLVAINGWQIRLHRVSAEKKCTVYETGFAVENNPDLPGLIHKEEDGHYFVGNKGFSGISAIMPSAIKRVCAGITGYPNTNLMTPETVFLPGLQNDLPCGSHFLCTAVYAHPNVAYARTKWSEKPTAILEDGILRLSSGDVDVQIPVRG